MRSWQTKETRHYCQVCNAWMGNDKQSILLHENGKKHQENVERSLKTRRDTKDAQDKQAKQLKSSLAAMEQSALQSMTTGPDAHYFDTTSAGLGQPGAVGLPPYAGAGMGMYAQPIHSTVSATAPLPPPPPPPAPSQSKAPPPAHISKEDKKEWKALKKQRQEEKKKKDADSDNDNDDDLPTSQQSKKKRRIIAPDEGHYTLMVDENNPAGVVKSENDTSAPPTTESTNSKPTTYLEGIVFAELLEPDMPIQIWTGSNLSSAEERKLAHNQSLWKNGLVVNMKRKKKPTNNSDMNDEDRMVVSVAYLKLSTDQDETLEHDVRLHRIRIVLGGDESIPETLEEARILAMGGEEIDTSGERTTADRIDEATGLSGWSTVQIKRTTKHQEAREERQRERQQQRLARRATEDAAKEAAMRRLEESKVANAEDSALGAFDVWSQTAKGGYKGVDIHTEANITVADTAKRLAAKGEAVAFKKGKFGKDKIAGKKRNRRVTSADDD